MSVVARSPGPGCGFPDGRKACQDLFHSIALRTRELAWTGSLRTWRLLHDVYDIQHEEEFCGRYKGLVAHLGGVCWAIEYGGSETGYRALQTFIERNAVAWKDLPYPPEPGIPTARGVLTVASLEKLADAEQIAAGVDRWARAAWVAYAPLQPVAREWVQQALALARNKR